MFEGGNGQELCFNTISTGDGRLKGSIFILFYSIPVLFVLPVTYDVSRESISETKKGCFLELGGTVVLTLDTVMCYILMHPFALGMPPTLRCRR